MTDAPYSAASALAVVDRLKLDQPTTGPLGGKIIRLAADHRCCPGGAG